MSAVHLTFDGAVAEIRLDNPAKLNCFTADMLTQFAAHLDAVEDSDARLVLVTATEAKCFCSGADITGWGALSPRDFARHWVRGGHRLFDRLARLAQPSIAVMQGHAFGGGLELAAACDIRVMAPGAMIALPESGIGIVPGWSGTQRLARLLPEPVLREMALFGRRIPAERAHSLGFIAEIAEDPRAAALTIAERAVTLSPRATEITKQMILAGRGEDQAALIEALGAAAIAASEDRDEGVASFREKRKALFSGK
ncbi:enoyl-CoA hydratase/isomerase family protein [Pseudogemmobacter bohemicus]|uniref:enoyl-CoA hydratase/isomerase family protein n=1 Tax=Pseudogemmobacter bohemicus TaxID=2250708 RepID=UPI000DD4BF09|nr:enoyl-CoA hydratase/isomerase family protein [Pseudogemmobacter bohemicus]